MIDLPKSNFTVDHLKLFFKEPETIAGITINQPGIYDIIKFGEKDFYNMLNPFITNPTACRLQLWNIGTDWNKISEFELFTILSKNLSQKETSIIFGELDFSLFKLKAYEKDGKKVLFLINEEQGRIITEDIYKDISLYLRTMFNIFPKTEKIKGRTGKEWAIEEERINLANKLKQGDIDKSSLLTLVSSCVNHPGFKYNTRQLKEENVGIYEFMDAVQRLQIYESTTALLKGMYSGFVDVSKITDKDQFNFMRDISQK